MLEWLKKSKKPSPSSSPHGEPSGVSDTVAVLDPMGFYLRFIKDTNQYLSLRGLLHGHVPKILLSDIYIDLKAVAGDPTSHPSEAARLNPVGEELPVATEVRTRLLDSSFYGERYRSAHIAVDDAMAAEKRLVILGEPGSGKSTFVRYIASRMLAEPELYRTKLDLPGHPVPLFVRLKSIKTEKLPTRHELADVCIPDLLRGDIPDGFVTSLLEKGICILIFDGLDEIADKVQRQKVALWIQEFAGTVHPANRFIVTSRIIGYREAPLAGGFSRFTLCDFDTKDIRAFVQRWFELVVESGASLDQIIRRKDIQYKTGKLVTIIESKPDIEQLAHNPLLLTIVLLVYTNRERLPEERYELYRQCIDVSLEHSQQARQDGAAGPLPDRSIYLRLDQRRDLLKRIARWLHQNGRTEESEQQIVAVALQSALPAMGISPDLAIPFLRRVEAETGLLVQRAGLLGFSHLAFQEFLASVWLAEMDDKMEATRMLCDVRLSSWWREVICLYAAIIPDSSLLLQSLLDARDTEFGHVAILAGACLADSRSVSQVAIRERVVRRLSDMYLDSTTRFMRRLCRDTLISIGGQEVLTVFVSQLDNAVTRMSSMFQPDDPSTVIELVDIVDLLSRLESGACTTRLFELAVADDKPETVRLACLRGLRQGAVLPESAEEMLDALAWSDASLPLRQEAFAALGRLSISRTRWGKIQEYLSSVYEDRRVDDLYVACLLAFIHRFSSADGYALIRQCLSIERIEELKVGICRAVLEIESQENARIDFLLELLRNGMDWGTRGGAALVLGTSTSRRGEIAHRLCERLKTDLSLGVGMRIAESLQQLGWKDAKVVNALKDAIIAASHRITKWRLIECYVQLTRDRDFIADRVMPVLDFERAIEPAEQISGLRVLRMGRVVDTVLANNLTKRLATFPSEVTTEAIEYLLVCGVFRSEHRVELLKRLHELLKNPAVDSVVKDRSQEAIYTFYPGLAMEAV